MARDKRGPKAWFGRAFDLASFLGQQVASNWAALSTYFSGGAAMSALAYFQDVPPLAWGAAFFAGLLGVAVIRFINSAGAERRARAEYEMQVARPPVTVNPLRKSFEGEKISLADFWHPNGHSRSYNNVSIHNCQIHGPGSMALDGHSVMADCIFSGCDLVCILPGSVISTAVLFNDATIKDCQLVSVTLYLGEGEAQALMQKMNPTGKGDFRIFGFPPAVVAPPP